MGKRQNVKFSAEKENLFQSSSGLSRALLLLSQCWEYFSSRISKSYILALNKAWPIFLTSVTYFSNLCGPSASKQGQFAKCFGWSGSLMTVGSQNFSCSLGNYSPTITTPTLDLLCSPTFHSPPLPGNGVRSASCACACHRGIGAITTSTFHILGVPASSPTPTLTPPAW